MLRGHQVYGLSEALSDVGYATPSQMPPGLAALEGSSWVLLQCENTLSHPAGLGK